MFLRSIYTLSLIQVMLIAAPGDIDRSFGNNGNVISGLNHARCLAVQDDGKIIVAGRTVKIVDGVILTDFALERYESNGTIDSTFGTNGHTVTHIPNTGQAGIFDIALQSNGKIITTGADNSGDGNYLTVCYESNGTLDKSFGVQGIATEPMGGRVSNIAIKKNGKIVLAGDGDSDSNQVFALLSYEENGTLDKSFGGGDGKVFTGVGQGGGWITGIALQDDGKIVTVGTADEWELGWKMAIVRYTAEGVVDTEFGMNGNGIVKIDFDTDSNFATDIAIQKDGKIIVTGEGGGSDIYDSHFATARLKINGTLDETFGLNGDGKVLSDFAGESASNLAIQENGKILLAGLRHLDTGSNVKNVLLRYDNNATVDESFGEGNGEVLFDGNGIEDIALQKNGKILVLGDNTIRRFEGDEVLQVIPLAAIYYLLN